MDTNYRVEMRPKDTSWERNVSPMMTDLSTNEPPSLQRVVFAKVLFLYRRERCSRDHGILEEYLDEDLL